MAAGRTPAAPGVGRFHYPGKQHQIAGGPHPLSLPTRTPTLPVPLPPTWGLLFPGLRPSIGSLHLRYPLLLWGSREGEGARPGAHNILSTFMVDWEMGWKASSPTGSPPTHTFWLWRERIPLIAGPQKDLVVKLWSTSLHHLLLLYSGPEYSGYLFHGQKLWLGKL